MSDWRFAVGDVIREVGSAETWRVIKCHDVNGVRTLDVSGPGPCRGIMRCDDADPDIELVYTADQARARRRRARFALTAALALAAPPDGGNGGLHGN